MNANVFLVAPAIGNFSRQALSLGAPQSWLWTVALAIGWLVLMLAYSPIADRFATRLVSKPPTLGAFRALRQSRAKLLLGIVVAWVLGGFLEEIVLRGMGVRGIESFAAQWLPAPAAIAAAVCAIAVVAGILHLYQGLRAAIIIAQLSLLFGLLFVLSGFNLWAVILCHGLYDTIAFVRFANGTSRYGQYAAAPNAAVHPGGINKADQASSEGIIHRSSRH